MSAVEEAMKAAKVDYVVKGTSDDIKPETDKSAGIEDKEALEAEALLITRKAKLAPYTSDKFLKDIGESVGDIIKDTQTAMEAVNTAAGAGNAMDVLIQVKRVSTYLETINKDVLPYANSMFIKEGYLGTQAKISNYSPRRSWSYSKKLTEQMAVIDARKKIEQKSGDATDVTKTVDVLESKLFAISLK